MDYDWKINDANNIKALIGMNRADWESKNHWAQITNLTDIQSPSFDKTIGTQTSSGNFYWDGQLGFFEGDTELVVKQACVETDVGCQNVLPGNVACNSCRGSDDYHLGAIGVEPCALALRHC